MDGKEVATARLEDDEIIAYEQEFPDGISEVVLRVSDGQNTTIAHTTVMVGDHEAPVVDCNQGEFVNGDLRARDFQAVVPDLGAIAVVSDNVTPAADLLLAQVPRAGQVVGQGVHPITVTARDAAGNVGRCTVYLLVQEAVRFDSISNYDTFPAGAEIPVRLSYEVVPTDIVETTVYLNGVVEHVARGVLVQPLQLNLDPGRYEIHAVITNAGGRPSQSRSIRFDVLADPPPTPVRAPVFEITWESEQHETLLLRFHAPADVRCCIQMNPNLDPEGWVTIHLSEGTGQELVYRHQADPSTTPKMFFRLLHLPK